MQYKSFIIWAVVLLVFVVLWRKGYLAKFSRYVALTKEELRKCSWPTRPELVASTMVVLVATILLGGYTVVVDTVISSLLRTVLSL